MKPLLTWVPKLSTAKILQKISLILAVSCVVAIPFSGIEFPRIFIPVVLVLLMFPLYAVAMIIIGARAAARPRPKKMPNAKDVRELIFCGLPPRFYKGFVLVGTAVTWLGTYIFIRAMGNDSWPDFGISVGAVIAMIPLMFNIASYGIFSSVVIERTKEGLGQQPPPLSKPEQK